VSCVFSQTGPSAVCAEFHSPSLVRGSRESGRHEIEARGWSEDGGGVVGVRVGSSSPITSSSYDMALQAYPIYSSAVSILGMDMCAI
jgi:hypothetical protein